MAVKLHILSTLQRDAEIRRHVSGTRAAVREDEAEARDASPPAASIEVTPVNMPVITMPLAVQASGRAVAPGKSEVELARLREAVRGGTFKVDARVIAERILADEE